MSFLERADVQQTPLGRLIHRELIKQDRRPHQLVRQLGYVNVTKGLRRLEMAIIHGETAPMIRDRLAQSLGISEDRVQQVIERTERLVGEQHRRQERQNNLNRRRRQRREFRPHLLALTERDKPPVGMIVIATLTWPSIEAGRKVPLPPDVVRSRGKRREQLMKELIRAHHIKTEGRVPILGRIEGYALISQFGVEPTWFFDVEGNRVSKAAGRVPGEARSIVAIRGRNVIEREWTA